MEYTFVRMGHSPHVRKYTALPFVFFSVLYTKQVRDSIPGIPASLRKDTYPETSACEVGWAVPFLAAFISSVLPRVFSQGIESDSNRRPSREACYEMLQLSDASKINQKHIYWLIKNYN